MTDAALGKRTALGEVQQAPQHVKRHKAAPLEPRQEPWQLETTAASVHVLQADGSLRLQSAVVRDGMVYGEHGFLLEALGSPASGVCVYRTVQLLSLIHI